ncbi:bifunctional ornithine acetyltransferase/N-acetylglutamate synthase [Thermaerobacter composti]|uniref:Arginine biosynthesis bifunctional protein ArgJ n=1 Tax=Thermaerobacter composti TaxID=554949 RepID=A0ABZ0QPY3_9FIRM|nr:bifunctional ornithine acetyltransferase/N-acetylglutamate synthase [Thermaerobacter composti]WPD19559.1 bifunctional ornithine acetyltransferase/N-acetylglutamate synthase [Thermaerobacter composti]
MSGTNRQDGALAPVAAGKEAPRPAAVDGEDLAPGDFVLRKGWGVTVPAGFKAAGLHCGIKRRKPDLGWIVADGPCAAAAVYTRNRVHAPCLDVTRDALAATGGYLQAVVCNSGNANVCTPRAATDARELQALVAAALDVAPELVAVAQTGVIGEPMPMAAVRQGVVALPAATSAEGGDAFAEAILTTDTRPKQWGALCALPVAPAGGRGDAEGGARPAGQGPSPAVGGRGQGDAATGTGDEAGAAPEDPARCRFVRIGAAAKGSGMIHPDMATMLAFITTDAAIEPAVLADWLREVVDRTFNAITVDGDTSTNDMVIVLASGRAGGPPLAPGRPGWDTWAAAAEAVCDRLAREIAADGEGATRLITVEVEGAPGDAEARQVARTVAASPLVKAAVHGADANWGRVLAAAGRSGVALDPSRVDIELGPIPVCRGGFGVPFDEGAASAYLRSPEVTIRIRVGDGPGRGRAYGCDLSPDYVHINASYRT